MSIPRKALIPAAVALALSLNTAYAADEKDCEEIEGTPAGLYLTTDEGHTFIIKDDKVVELGPGQTGYANEDEVKCIRRPPRFMDWPCGTQAAQSRMFNTYSIEDLTSDNKLKEVVERYFTVPEVIAPIPSWIDGEYHGVFNYHDIIQFASPEYWYLANKNRPVLDGKRPKLLLISLFVGTNQVVIDNNVIDALHKELGSDDMPVAFLFNDSNTVPISYFGSNVSLEEVFKAFNGRGIKVAEVPMWWQGDYHLMPTIEEFEKYFKIPALEDISAEKQQALRMDLEANGFTQKSILVTLFAESESMAVDQPERIRVAASMGYKQIPTALFFMEPDSILARCGPGTPEGSQGVSGSTTPIGGATVPPTAPVMPPPDAPQPPNAPQPPASES
jgi:hypothetical protein